jgi:hypothetical protein
VLESPRLVLREDDDLASPLCEPLEHSNPILAQGSVAAEGAATAC